MLANLVTGLGKARLPRLPDVASRKELAFHPARAALIMSQKQEVIGAVVVQLLSKEMAKYGTWAIGIGKDLYRQLCRMGPLPKTSIGRSAMTDQEIDGTPQRGARVAHRKDLVLLGVSSLRDLQLIEHPPPQKWTTSGGPK